MCLIALFRLKSSPPFLVQVVSNAEAIVALPVDGRTTNDGFEEGVACGGVDRVFL